EKRPGGGGRRPVIAARLLGIFFRDAIEELIGLGREQPHLFLLDEHREHGIALARLDHEDAVPRLPVRAGPDLVDRIELDELGHDVSWSRSLTVEAPAS